jgi:hypothetical protein
LIRAHRLGHRRGRLRILVRGLLGLGGNRCSLRRVIGWNLGASNHKRADKGGGVEKALEEDLSVLGLFVVLWLAVFLAIFQVRKPAHEDKG